MTRKPIELTDSPERGPAPVDLVSDVLSMLRLAGAIFLRAEFTSPWAYESPPPDDLASVLETSAERLILFHIIAEGQCWIRTTRGNLLDLCAGDVVVLPYADQHIVGSPERVPPSPIGELIPPPPWDQFPVVRYGGGGERTTIVCGYLHCDDPIFNPLLRTLPPLFSVQPPDGPAAAWISSSLQYALDAAEGRRTVSPSVALRLPEIVFGEVLRLYVESPTSVPSAWLAAVRDPVVGPALVEIHANPERRWTIDDLAKRVAYSRSTLDERFRRLLGRAPMQYLGEWRLQVAANLLQETKLSVAEVAHRVGYESEEAFNRAFKRTMGSPPAQWRQRAIVHPVVVSP
jgi:AraC-like DNA-binding protein